MSDTLKCPSCGGLNQLPDGINKMFCAFCGNIVESETEYFSEEITESSIKTKPQIINKRLSLTNRKIKSLSEIIDWFTDDELLNIYTLDLSENEISSFDGIIKFRKLSRLDISYNKISEVDIFWNSSIYELNLCGNQISSLKLLESFKALERLDLSNNDFQNITDEDVSFINSIIFNNERWNLSINLKSNPLASINWINKVQIRKILDLDELQNNKDVEYEFIIETDLVVGEFNSNLLTGYDRFGWYSPETGEKIDTITNRKNNEEAKNNNASIKNQAEQIVKSETQKIIKKKNLRNNLIKLLLLITFSWFIYYYIINKNTSDAENVIQPDISTQDTATSKENITTTKKKKSKKNNSPSKLILGTWKTKYEVDGVKYSNTITFSEDNNLIYESENADKEKGKWQVVDDGILFSVNEEYSTTKIKVDGDVFNGQITIKETGDNIEIKGERVK